jgi:hypothetical protein
MKERVINFGFNKETIARDRITAVKEYVENLNGHEMREALRIAGQLESETKPLPTTVIVIPVAAHSEAGNIEDALSHYSKQVGNDPFAIHLHMNWPFFTVKTAGIIASFAAIERARISFPQLDIRVSTAEYDEPIIGNIRRQAWNGTLVGLYTQSVDIGQAIGINHDIDLKALSTHYIANVQQYYKEIDSQPDKPVIYLPAALTQAKHAHADDYPNSSKVIFWRDFTTRMCGRGYEASIIIPFATYALRNGFNNEACTHETWPLTNYGQGTVTMIKGTSLETSPRRYIDRLPTNDFDTIWTDESFGADDVCRIKSNSKDLNDKDAWLRIAKDAPNFAQDYIVRLIWQGLTGAQQATMAFGDKGEIENLSLRIIGKVRTVEKLTRFVLDRALKFHSIGEHLSAHSFSEENIRYEIEVYIAYKKKLLAGNRLSS